MHRALLAFALLPSLASTQGVDPQDAWREFNRTQGTGWQVVWNAATGTPRAVFGPGLRLSGPVASLAAARATAGKLLDAHSDLLGRGASTFVEIIGAKANKTYILVYDQEFKGLPVISGRADLRINEIGVVAMMGSRAIPIPADFKISPKLTTAAARALADQAVLAVSGVDRDAPVKNNSNAARLVIWADAEAAAPTRPVLAWEIQVDARPAEVTVGKAYIDAATGAMLKFENEVLECSCGTAHVAGAAPKNHRERMERAAAMAAKLAAVKEVDAPAAAGAMALTGRVMGWMNADHLPTDPLTNVAMPNLLVTSSAGNAYTDANGDFSIPYTGTAPVTVTATLQGRYCSRVRVSTGTQLTASRSVTPGTPATIQFGSSGMGEQDWSQTTTYWFTNDCYEWMETELPGSTGPLASLAGMDPRVNIASSCNAYYTNFTINFYNRSSRCAMTAFETVIQHEYGHGADHAFGGISQTDGLSEGWGDILCLYRSRQKEVGPGFFIGQTVGIRQGDNPRTYPAGGGVHQQGQTWMGFAWDLRGFLMTTHGNAAGEAIANRIVIQSIAADATNQPDAVREVFIVDDDDGNLLNGTPNYDDLEKAAIKRTLPYPMRQNPNAGTYTTYGMGCPGSGQSSGSCQSANSGTTDVTSTQNSNIFALGVPPSSGVLVVTGFELFTGALGSPLTIDTQIFGADSAGAPTGAPLRTGQMTIGSTKGWYRTTFASPLVVLPNTKFFLSYTSVASQMYFPFAPTGTRTSHFWHPAGPNPWRGTPPNGFVTQNWAWKVNCQSGPGAIPQLTNTGVPEINDSFSLNLAGARTNAPALLLLGASDTQWGAIPLPFDLGLIGAPNCTLLASGNILLPLTTSSVGTSTQTFMVPNDPTIVGALFYNQFAIQDTVNPFGWVVSNAGAGKVGR